MPITLPAAPTISSANWLAAGRALTALAVTRVSAEIVSAGVDVSCVGS
jgi:hypothetical protein